MATDKYKVFLEAIDVGSFSGAAEKLGYTPSGVVHMMNSLCARKRCESTARVILKSAFGKAVGVLWNAYH